MDSVIEALAIERFYPHPPELVFRAWTEPVRLERWFSPNPANKVTATVDLKKGGKYRISMRNPSGDTWTVQGTYLSIVKPLHLSFTWQWEGESEESRVTVEFVAEGAGTRVAVKHERVTTMESFTGHRRGWESTMERLSEYLSNPMETLVMPPSTVLGAAAQIKQAKDLAQLALNRLRITFGHVPNDKLLWRTTETAKSALQIYAHCGLSNQYFASVLRGEELPLQSAEEVVAQLRDSESKYTDRQQAEQLFEESAGQVLRAIDTLDVQLLVSDPKVAFVLLLVGRHNDGHASQIDYLQTQWGDLVDHLTS